MATRRARGEQLARRITARRGAADDVAKHRPAQCRWNSHHNAQNTRAKNTHSPMILTNGFPRGNGVLIPARNWGESPLGSLSLTEIILLRVCPSSPT